MRAFRMGRAAAALVALSVATVAWTAPALAVSPIAITVENTSTRAVTGLYLSLYADRGWGPDQLDGAPIASGGSTVVSGAVCTSGSIVAIAEDESGCFLYRSLSCSGDATWTITNSTTRDCGR